MILGTPRTDGFEVSNTVGPPIAAQVGRGAALFYRVRDNRTLSDPVDERTVELLQAPGAPDGEHRVVGGCCLSNR